MSGPPRRPDDPFAAIIRAPDPDDAEALIRLVNRLALEAEHMVITELDPVGALPAVRDYITSRAEADQETALVVESGGTLVGLLTANRTSSQAARRGVVDLDMGLVPEARRRGLGRRLLAEAEAWARRVQVHRLQLLVMTENLPAIALYESNGFAREGRLRACVNLRGRWRDQWLMARLLG